MLPGAKGKRAHVCDCPKIRHRAYIAQKLGIPPPVPKKGTKKPPSMIGRAGRQCFYEAERGLCMLLMQLPGQVFGLSGFKCKNAAAGVHRLFRHALA